MSVSDEVFVGNSGLAFLGAGPLIKHHVIKISVQNIVKASAPSCVVVGVYAKKLAALPLFFAYGSDCGWHTWVVGGSAGYAEDRALFVKSIR